MGHMSETGKKKWLIKDRDGRVRGPFYTDDILARISRGEFTGEEFIALYPSTNWIPISNDPQFYDQLLDSLDNESFRPEDSVRVAGAVSKQLNTEEEPEPIIEQKSRAQRVSHTNNSQTSQNSDVKPHAREEQSPVRPPDIELQNIKKILKRAKSKSSRLPIITVLLVLLAVFFYLFDGEIKTEDRVYLLAPRKGRPVLNKDIVRQKTSKAIAEYVKDNFSGYQLAQSELVQVLEGDPRNAGAIALTCLTYLELWPYAFQDAEDLQTIGYATQMASKIDPAGIEAATCKTVDLFVRGRYVEAKSITEMALDNFAKVKNPPIAFYYFKAKLFESEKDFASAASYAQSAQQLWAKWLRVYSFEASMLAKSGNFNAAANKYRAILKANPNHKVSRIELGRIEYVNLRNLQEGEKQIGLAINQQERVPRDVQAKAYLTLAEISLQKQDRSKALSFAQKAYALNSYDSRAKEIILSIGGQKKLNETKIFDSQLVYEGDQLVLEGDCNAAQAHYKAAYNSNKKNGLAAMKAAECLWAISLSTDAMTWLNNAIRADPALVDAYVLLADYYSQRYSYEAAGKILAKARTQSPQSYKVYRGLALVEYRRNGMTEAINYALRAIQYYEADVESYIILSKAYLKHGDSAKAFEAGSKAIEIDVNNRQAQIVYAESLAATRGISVGLDYLNRLVNIYPTITEYRLALGELYARDQSYSSAQQIFIQVIRIEEKPKKAYVELGKTYQAQNKFEAARDAFFNAASIDPSDVEPLFLAGQLYLQAKQPKEAKLQFQRVIRINKEYPLVNYFMGKAALEMGSPEEALVQANLEKTKNPGLADPYILAADAYTELRQYSACAGEYRRAVELRPADSNMYVKMARCYRMSGNLDAAVSMINQAATQESANPEVWKEQGSIFEMRQDTIRAIEAYNQYLLLAPNAVDRVQIEMRINTLSR